eukprot:m.183779 g.183779  ORF g.183779 m.183779 type:complete len:55 (+) comp25517_c0_seq14:469-633(+)
MPNPLCVALSISFELNRQTFKGFCQSVKCQLVMKIFSFLRMLRQALEIKPQQQR